MKAASLVSHENSFQTSGIDAAGKKFILKPINVKINSTGESFQIMDCSRENKSKDHYYVEETAKKKIILHFTMGYLKGDIATLTKGHVSVPFVVGRNGIIYNLFASKYWSYHLGPDAVGGNTPMSRESIGIEISNIGPLKRVGDNLVTTYSNTDVYCSLQETQYYTKLPTKYRTYEYFATYTEAQYKAVILLLKFLCEKYSLPKAFISADKRYLLLDETTFVNFKGIATHVNCRTGKVDIGPAFDWNRVIAAVSA
jgi:N-acetyl-anhydromuramyl-L-alanine amidase AmpD